MTTIETTASVTADHRLVVDTNAPAEIPPGVHRVVVVIQPQTEAKATAEPLFHPYPVGPVSEEITYSGAQLYGE